MEPSVAELFEEALRRRGAMFCFDAASERYEIRAPGNTLLVSLENLERQYRLDGAPEGIDRFVDLVLLRTHTEVPQWEIAKSQALHCFELNDYAEPPEYRVSVTARVDRVPALLDTSAGTLTWIEPEMVSDWGVTIEDIVEAGNANLSTALRSATLRFHKLEPGRLGYFETSLPFKAPLLFAPNLRLAVEADIGWPIHAAIPDRDFLFIWSAKCSGIDRQVAATVIEEFEASPYPLTIELLEISDAGIRAIGNFSVLVEQG